jgi:hypothetical protein
VEDEAAEEPPNEEKKPEKELIEMPADAPNNAPSSFARHSSILLISLEVKFKMVLMTRYSLFLSDSSPVVM